MPKDSPAASYNLTRLSITGAYVARMSFGRVLKNGLFALAGVVFLAFCGVPGVAAGESDGIGALNRQLDSFPVVDEIDTAAVAPVAEYPENASSVTNLLGRAARVLPSGATAKSMAWVIGRKRGLKPGAAYVLSVEFPDDLPRAIFIANRGADQVRGFTTGSATGDARKQYTQPSLESLNYPQTGSWQRYRSVFFLHERFQGLKAHRNPDKGGRPFVPDDGFHVVLFQTKHLNDPRNEGVAVGKIRLHEVADFKALYPAPEYPPAGLPRRHLFFREEMADECISAAAVADRAVADPVEWYVNKARVERMLGFNTFTKDLLEFGFNQGWDSGDNKWIANAQPPLTDLWQRLVPRIAAEGMDILPYYEYKGGVGVHEAKPQSLAWQRRAEKLYHGLPNTNYTGVWWVESHNADLTDPDTLADAKRLLDRTILSLKDKAPFAGAWFRTRGNHLPVGFGESTLARFRSAFPKDEEAQKVSRQTLIASYEGDGRLYRRYIDWWLEQRRAFLSALQRYVSEGLSNKEARVLFTPWPGEPIPMLRNPDTGTKGHPDQIVTDDPSWWDALAKTQPNDSWIRWALVPTAFDKVVKDNHYGKTLDFEERISPAPSRNEEYHSAPNADPERYQSQAGVMMTYPFGRLFTVARPDLLERFHTTGGMAMVRHFPLNEDDAKDDTGPFSGHAGYASVDVDHAGPFVRLEEARAVANGDPSHIGYLCGSAFSCGFPEYVRRFNLAFLAVPALPSQIVPNAASDPEVVVRSISTEKNGKYFFVVNTSMQLKKGVEVNLPAGQCVRDLVGKYDLPAKLIGLELYPGELRSYATRER